MLRNPDIIGFQLVDEHKRADGASLCLGGGRVARLIPSIPAFHPSDHFKAASVALFPAGSPQIVSDWISQLRLAVLRCYRSSLAFVPSTGVWFLMPPPTPVDLVDLVDPVDPGPGTVLSDLNHGCKNVLRFGEDAQLQTKLFEGFDLSKCFPTARPRRPTQAPPTTS